MPNNAVSLSRVITGRAFVVPDYQRPYAWTKRQLDDLWQDLDLMNDKSKHYTGTLVLKELDAELVIDEGETLAVCEVVDGQQRLTTSLILIDQLRRALEQLGDPAQSSEQATWLGPMGRSRSRANLTPGCNSERT